MTVAQRIKAARTGAGLTLAKVGAACGVSAQAVARWEEGSSEPGISSITQISLITGRSFEYLLLGTDSQLSATLPRIGGRLVPRVDWPNSTYVNTTNANGAFHTSFPCGPRSFSCLISDRSNSPALEPGDAVIIDPDAKPQPGDLVMAVMPGPEVVLRRYRPRQGAVELAPINSDWPTVTIPALDDAVFVGTLTELTKPRK